MNKIRDFLIVFHTICTCGKNKKCNCEIKTGHTFYIIKEETAQKALDKFWGSDTAYDKRCFEDLTLRVEVFSIKSLLRTKKRPIVKRIRKGEEVNWENSIEPGSGIRLP